MTRPKHTKKQHAKAPHRKSHPRPKRQDNPIETNLYPEQKGAEFQTLNRVTPGAAEGDPETIEQDLADKEHKSAA